MLSIIIPTKNEESNIRELIRWIKFKEDAEIIVVDDSADNTKKEALKSGAVVLNGKGSLGASVIEGFKQASNECVLVMDGDLSHSPDYISEMLKYIKDYDLVVGSRVQFHEGKLRNIISKIGKLLSGIKIKDPLSGFFMIKKDKIPPNLKCNGFKILLEILNKSNLRIKEIPIVFGDRQKGKSKFDIKEGIYFCYQVGRENKFVKYSIVGGLGVLINLGLLFILTELGLHYMVSGVVGFVVSFISNYQLNKRWTFT